ncbi:MAG: DUF364 domain-containing protein [Bacteroidales bacterium]|nr:DUF364 domain-containing protein [Bacteroidales bacterium]
MEEPIKHFYSLRGFDRSNIKKWAIGEKYIAIMNQSGNIGVCATLGTKMNERLIFEGEADTDDPAHRIILNAYFNSILNYERDYSDIKDIFESVDFSRYRRIVMVGYFESLYQKFLHKGLPLEVFDIQKQSHILSDLSKMENSLSGAEAIILTGTTVFNKTFNELIGIAPDNCSIFLLGPSNILSEEMFRYQGIKVVFGSVFRHNDNSVLDIVGAGHGTRGFLPYLNKVYIARNDYKHEIQ